MSQKLIADVAAGGAVVFFGVSAMELLQGVGLILTILCAGFSLYFHIRRFFSGRKARIEKKLANKVLPK